MGADVLLRRLAAQRVHDRLLDVEVEGVAELVLLRLVRPLTARAVVAHGVVAEAVATQPGEEVAERLLADPAHAARGELEAAAVALDQPGILELLGDLRELVDAARRLVAERLAQLLAGALVDLPAAVGVAQGALQLLHPL